MNSDNMHEIFPDKLNLQDLDKAMSDVSASIRAGQEHLEDLKDNSYAGFSSTKLQESRDALNKQAKDMVEDIKTLAEEALEGRLQVDEKEEEVQSEPSFQEQNKRSVNFPVIDLAKYKSQILSFGMNASVGIKEIVPNIRKQVKIAKKNFAIVAISMALASGVTLGASAGVSTIIENMQENDFLGDAMENYRLYIFEKNRSDVRYHENDEGQMQPIYSYNMQGMITSLHEKYEDSLLTWYFYYNAFMKYGEEYTLNKSMNQILGTYNAFYNTDYENMKDFLIKNNFEDESEFKEYVALQVEAHKERTARGI